MNKEHTEKLESIEYIMESIESNLVDLNMIYEVEYQIRTLKEAIISNSRISSLQNLIMIFLTIAILYLTYVMAKN